MFDKLHGRYSCDELMTNLRVPEINKSIPKSDVDKVDNIMCT